MLNMFYGKVAVGVLIGVATLSSPAFAQDRRLDFSVRAHVEQNSNVARTNEALAAAQGLQLEDTVFTPTATIDFARPVGRNSLYLRGSAGYSFYDKNKRLDRERLDLSGGFNARLGPCVNMLTGTFSRGLSLIEDPTLIADVNNIQETRRAGLEIRCSRATGLGVVASASKEWADNELTFLEEGDYERVTYMAGVSYSRPTFGTLTVFGNHQETEYPNRLLGGGFEVDSIGATYERQLGARIQGTVTAAFTKAEQVGVATPAAAVADIETTTYNAALSYRVSSRLRLQAAFDRAVLPSSGFGRTYDLTEAFRFNADYDLGSRIRFALAAAQVDRDSEGAPAGPVVLTNARTRSLSGSVRYKQSERVSLVLNVGQDERTTNAPQFDYTSDRIGIAAEVTF